ncbi:hypothetical protein BH11VER1_BH11VER1_04130 [soil metagenome]
MKHSVSVTRILTVGVLTATLASCASTEAPRKRKPVPPSDSLSGLPWNRPRSFESSAGMGRALPQSR